MPDRKLDLPQEIKRPNYFTSQFLVEADFKDEQAYHVEMRRLHNRALHVWGVVDGLTVSKTGAQEVTVSAGMAIDKDGKEIVLPVLPTPQKMQVPKDKPGDLFVVISYDQNQQYVYSGTGLTDTKYTRTVEGAQLDIRDSAPDDGSVIKLARLRVEQNGLAGDPDNGVRRLAGSAIPRVLGGVTIGSAYTGTEATDGNLLVQGNVGIGRRGPATEKLVIDSGSWTPEARVLFRTAASGNDEYVWPAIRLRAGWFDTTSNELGQHRFAIESFVAHTNPETWKRLMTVKANGNVGIGAGDPGKTLTVNGGLRVDSEVSVGGSGAFEVDAPGVPGGRLKINPDGKVGIGTTAPLGPLSVGNSSVDGSDGYIVLGKKGGVVTRHCRLGYDGESNFVIGDYGSNNAAGTWKPQFGINWNAPSNSLYIAGSGNVGIGASAPAAPLHVTSGFAKTDTTARNVATFSSNDATNPLGLRIQVRGGTDANAAKRYASLQVKEGDETRLLILQADGGSVGIGGTVDPSSAILQIAQTASDADRRDLLELQHTANNSFLLSGFGKSHTVSASTIQLAAWNGEQNISIVTDSRTNVLAGGSTKGIFIKSGGNVGVGQQTPSAKLSVRGNEQLVQVPGEYNSAGTGDRTIYFPPGNSIANVRQAGVQPGDLVEMSGVRREVESLDPFRLKDPGFPSGTRSLYVVRPAADPIFRVDDYRGNPRLSVSGDGNVGIWTTNPRAVLDVAETSPNKIKSVLARMDEGNELNRGAGTCLAVKSYTSQGDGNPSFALEHYFYGNLNGWIQFCRGGSATGGFVKISPGAHLRGEDLAELFETAGQIAPGDVVVFDEREEVVKLCESEADSCVIGIVSSEPAGVLGKDGGNASPIALCGRVPCHVDADIAPIQPGDLLTTSPTKGHAQKVLDEKRAAGAIIGKALGSLEKGKGKITVLVALA